MQMFYLNSNQNCLQTVRSLNGKIFIIILLGSIWNHRGLCFSYHNLGEIYNLGNLPVIKGSQMVPSKVETTLTLKNDHLLLSNFRMKGLVSKIGLPFSISVPRVISLCHSVQSPKPSVFI